MVEIRLQVEAVERALHHGQRIAVVVARGDLHVGHRQAQVAQQRVKVDGLRDAAFAGDQRCGKGRAAGLGTVDLVARSRHLPLTRVVVPQAATCRTARVRRGSAP
jgi:hypothetical protein